MWNERPDADALLQARIARGWHPTATSTVDGAHILGHAACRFDPHDIERGDSGRE